MVVEIQTSKGYYYVVEIERRPLSLSDKYCAEIYFHHQRISLNFAHVEALSIALSRQNGRISNTLEISRVGLKKSSKGLRHIDTEIEGYATRILNEIRQNE